MTLSGDGADGDAAVAGVTASHPVSNGVVEGTEGSGNKCVHIVERNSISRIGGDEGDDRQGPSDEELLRLSGRSTDAASGGVVEDKTEEHKHEEEKRAEKKEIEDDKAATRRGQGVSTRRVTKSMMSSSRRTSPSKRQVAKSMVAESTATTTTTMTTSRTSRNSKTSLTGGKSRLEKIAGVGIATGKESEQTKEDQVEEGTGTDEEEANEEKGNKYGDDGGEGVAEDISTSRWRRKLAEGANPSPARIRRTNSSEEQPRSSAKTEEREQRSSGGAQDILEASSSDRDENEDGESSLMLSKRAALNRSALRSSGGSRSSNRRRSSAASEDGAPIATEAATAAATESAATTTAPLNSASTTTATRPGAEYVRGPEYETRRMERMLRAQRGIAREDCDDDDDRSIDMDLDVSQRTLENIDNNNHADAEVQRESTQLQEESDDQVRSSVEVGVTDDAAAAVARGSATSASSMRDSGTPITADAANERAEGPRASLIPVEAVPVDDEEDRELIRTEVREEEVNQRLHEVIKGMTMAEPVEGDTKEAHRLPKWVEYTNDAAVAVSALCRPRRFCRWWRDQSRIMRLLVVLGYSLIVFTLFLLLGLWHCDVIAGGGGGDSSSGSGITIYVGPDGKEYLGQPPPGFFRNETEHHDEERNRLLQWWRQGEEAAALRPLPRPWFSWFSSTTMDVSLDDDAVSIVYLNDDDDQNEEPELERLGEVPSRRSLRGVTN